MTWTRCGEIVDSGRFECLDRLFSGNGLAEVLQGCAKDRVFSEVQELLSSLDVIELSGRDVAVRAAENSRALRRRGITTRKTIDTVIATRCIMDGYTPLHNDRDFDAFAKYLGLRVLV